METTLTIVTLSVTNLIVNLILLDFFSVKYKRRYKKTVQNIFLLLATALSVLINCIGNPTYNLIMGIVVFLVMNFIIFELNSSKDIFINISFMIVLLLLDAICHITIEMIMNYNILDTSTSLMENLKMIISSLMQFVVYNILKKYLLEKKINQISKTDILSYIILSIMSLLISGMIAIFINDVNDNIKQFFFLLVVSIIAFNIWFIKMMESLSQKQELEASVLMMNENSKMIFKHYQQLEEKEEHTRLILHDIKNHINILEKRSYMNQIPNDNYLEEFKEKVEHLTSKTIVDRKILNILFLEKIEEAKRYDINISFDIDAVDMSFISDFDIITIFSNILDNAIDAVKELDVDDRKITIHIKKIHDFILVCQTNMCLNKITKKDNKVLSSKKGHSGLGLQSIEHILDKYNANMVVDIDDNLIFSNTIMFTI